MSRIFTYIFSVIAGIGFIGMVPMDSDPQWLIKTCICFAIFIAGTVLAYMCSKWDIVCHHIFAIKFIIMMFFHMIVIRKSKFAKLSRKFLVNCDSVSECYKSLYNMYDTYRGSKRSNNVAVR